MDNNELNSFNSHLIFQQWQDGIIVVDNVGAIVLLNSAGESLLSYTEKELLGKKIHSILCAPTVSFSHDSSTCPFSADTNTTATDYEDNTAQEGWWVTKQGHCFHLDFKRICINQNQKIFTLFTFYDCSKRKHSERELQRLALYADLNPSLIVEFDSNGLIHYCNPAMVEEIANYGFKPINANEVISQDSAIPNILPTNTHQLIKQCLADGKTISNIETQIENDWFLWHFHPVLEGSSIQAYATNISELKKIESLLLTEKEKFLVTLNSITDGVITVDCDEKIRFINSDAIRMSGCVINSIEGKVFKDIVKILNINSRVQSNNIIANCIADGYILTSKENVLILHPDGYVTTVNQTVAPIFDSANKVIGAVIVLHDITETYQLEQKLSYQATHDQLTGLVNRLEFELRLNHIINIAYSDKISHAMLYLDIDNFKVINDTCGHLGGDKLLLGITDKLKTKFRRGDILGRLGGDEFGILLERCSIPMALKIAEEICLEISHYDFIWESQEYNISVGIGVVPINAGSDNVDQILSMADASCYAAKNSGRNKIHLYCSNDSGLLAKQGEILWVSKINKALKEDKFALYFQLIQPIFKTEGTHFEILIRMLDEHDNIILPDKFLFVAENYDLINSIDQWVIQHTFKWLAENQEVYDSISLCSINLSGVSIADISFAHRIIWELEDKQIDAHKICFEVTETVAIANLALAGQFIEILKEKGCSFSLDDFGSGMSSFGYLKELNIDFLKIDGQFVKDIVKDKIDEAMVKSINEIGHTMALKTIAEYVEDGCIYDKIKLLGVDFAQGYYIAKPEPLTNFAKPTLEKP